LKRHTAAGLAIAGLAVCSCATEPVPRLETFADRGYANSFELIDRSVGGADALVLDVPYDRQENRVACGAHVLASVVRYWRPDAEDVTGAGLFAARPPADMTHGYSLAELVALAEVEGLDAFGVRLPEPGLVAELEQGRPVLVPLALPSVWIQTHTLFAPDAPPLGNLKNLAIGRVGAMSALTGLAMGSHYVLVVGYADDRFVLLDPIMGYRTISRARLRKFRDDSGDAALVFSARPA
jgi:hypothetical protein